MQSNNPGSISGRLDPENLSTDMKLFAYLIEELKTEVRSVKEMVQTIQGTVSVIDATVKDLKTDSKRMWDRIEKLEQLHNNCPARHAQKGINARVKKLEDHDWEELKEKADQTGSISIPKRAPNITPQSIKRPQNLEPLWTKNFKVVISLMTAALFGAALAGALLVKSGIL